MVQAGRAPGRTAPGARLLALWCAVGLAGCGGENPVMTPVEWYHDLEGGTIAATRPPPPGADLPYPKLGTIPAKPQLPSNSVRQTLQSQLSAQRDDTERLAARNPIDTSALPPPPPPKPAPPAANAAQGSSEAASATMPAAEAPPPSAAPAPAPEPLRIVGTPQDEPNLPNVPDAPPGPPQFSAVLNSIPPARAPAPPAHVQPAASGTVVLFATGVGTLPPSQFATVRDLANTRGKGTLAIEGHGEAAADTPGAQQTALELGVQRAQAIAAVLAKSQVPAEKITLSATAFGRDAAVRLIP